MALRLGTGRGGLPAALAASAAAFVAGRASRRPAAAAAAAGAAGAGREPAPPPAAEAETPADKLRGDGARGRGAKREPVVLLACGSFNPPTFQHLRMFELARHALEARGYSVVGAYLSPVNDGYGKAGLLPARHRVAMCRRAVADSDLVMVDAWEAAQPEWQTTMQVLGHVRAFVNARRKTAREVRVMLLCGADLVETFRTPGLWADQDMWDLAYKYGIACVEREGADALRVAEEVAALRDGRGQELRVVSVREPVANLTSSTQLRRALREGGTVAYLTPRAVAEYIDEHNLYRE